MPPVKPKAKNYGVNSPAGSNTVNTCQQVTPANPNRTMLLIQNTGNNPGLIHFEEAVQGDGSDLLFAAGSGLLWDRASTCPREAISFGSELGTTWAILEQVTQ